MPLQLVVFVKRGAEIDLLELACGHVLERTHRGRQPSRTRCDRCRPNEKGVYPPALRAGSV